MILETFSCFFSTEKVMPIYYRAFLSVLNEKSIVEDLCESLKSKIFFMKIHKIDSKILFGLDKAKQIKTEIMQNIEYA